jgi:hypothetical protein
MLSLWDKQKGKTALGSTVPTIQWVPRVKGTEREAEHTAV